MARINHFSCRKTRMINLSYGIKLWAEVSFVLSQFTRSTDGRTGGHVAHGYDRPDASR